jgi:hypothetical protein
MEGKPAIQDLKEAVFEAKDLAEINTGGFKIVFKGLVNEKIEAIKLVLIPSDETDEPIREENLRRIFREINILGKCESSYLISLGSIPRHTDTRLDS